MSITREEAIASYEKLYEYMVGDDDAIKLDYGEFMELNHYIRTALRPVSRERVEKVWRAHWNESVHLGGFVYCSRCGYNALEANNYTFCPKCGSPFTDEAVEMVMRRLEALKDDKDM